ncbi:uncharacterized protein ARMOST_15097 [Armillaria ostoyae]|uniref:Uncharacterized protein n=1 Tax=Armillaria ostoyae TaxID=47428 RepID=A0A284RSF4_ARMOS|nr:uncharacterized protein ARMOST_15097 [Armillaria ostoyae]
MEATREDEHSPPSPLPRRSEESLLECTLHTARHVRAVDPTVSDWDLVPVHTPHRTLAGCGNKSKHVDRSLGKRPLHPRGRNQTRHVLRFQEGSLSLRQKIGTNLGRTSSSVFHQYQSGAALTP